MRMYLVKAASATLVLLKHECEDEKYVLDIADRAEAEQESGRIGEEEAHDKCLRAYLKMCSAGIFRDTTKSIQVFASGLLHHADYCIASIFTNAYVAFVYSDLTFTWESFDLCDVLFEMSDVDPDNFAVIYGRLDNFIFALRGFVEVYAMRLAGKSVATPFAKLSNGKLTVLLHNLLCGGEAGARSYRELCVYLRPTRFRVSFDSAADMMRYCSTQDISTITKCDTKFIEQQYIDYNQLAIASDFGKVVIV